MLRSRLSVAFGAALLLTACAGVDGTERGAIRENVVEPGITAIDDARQLACGADASALRTALESYELLEGDPAPDEAALVSEGYLRSETDSWDVVDGRIVASDPACGDAPATVPAAEIVTDSEVEVLSVDELMATFSDDDIADVGGTDCARQLAVIFSGAARYVSETGTDPGSLDDLADGGYLEEPITKWQVVAETVQPVDGSGCVDLFSGIPSAAD